MPVIKPLVQVRSVQVQELKRLWGCERIVTDSPHYLGKVLLYEAGRSGGLQYHRTKDETFYLLYGIADVESDNGSGELVTRRMTSGMSFHVPPGAVHRFRALTYCVVLEASTPVYNDRVRMEEAYGEPAGVGLPTTGEGYGSDAA